MHTRDNFEFSLQFNHRTVGLMHFTDAMPSETDMAVILFLSDSMLLFQLIHLPLWYAAVITDYWY